MADLQRSLPDPIIKDHVELQVKHDMIVLQEMLTQLKQLEVNIETHYSEVKRIELQRDCLKKRIDQSREDLRKIAPHVIDAEIIDTK